MTDEEKNQKIIEAHNEGQKDGSAREYHKPHGLASMAFSELVEPDAVSEQMKAENKAYDEGWEHGWKQRP